ncbi:unnamed protein product [Owenia fusiformis]|uniref:Claudin n=1 Tax=Owenia fusiformis TaxID=6347 RepID=A0A8S4Q2F5_OWEFU|nr:unnamed protein product [Owenia fusiformis]
MGFSGKQAWKHGIRIAAGCLMGSSFGSAIRAVANNRWGVATFQNSTVKYEGNIGLWQFCGGFNGTAKTCQWTKDMDLPQAHKAAIAMSMIGLILMVIAFVCLMITWCTVYAKKSGPLARYSIISIAAVSLLAVVCFLLAMAIFGTFFETWQKFHDYGPGTKKFLLTDGFYAIMVAGINGLIATIFVRVSAQSLLASEDQLPMIHVIPGNGQAPAYVAPATSVYPTQQYNTGYSGEKQPGTY